MSRVWVMAVAGLVACGRLSFDPLAGDGGTSGDSGDSGTPGSRIAYLKASNTGAGDEFGACVAISRDGSTIAVGAPLESSSARTINGNEADNSALEQGAVYVFVRSGATWVQQAYIKASNGDPGDQFGWSIALSGNGNTLVVGARHEDSISASQPANNAAMNAGAAYIYQRAGTTWMEQGIAKQAALTSGDTFGEHVAISDDGRVVAVGAQLEDSSATTINGNGVDDTFADAGAAYTFEYVGNQWSQMAYFKPNNTDAGDWFGWRVSLSAAGDMLAVAAFREDSNATTVDGNGADDSQTNAGAVYLFSGTASNWTQTAYIKPTVTDVGDNFGYGASLAGDGSMLVTAAIGEAGATGAPTDNSAPSSGALYVFVPTPWSQSRYSKAANPDMDDELGYGLVTTMTGNMVLLGAPFEDSAATGTGGNGNDNSASDSGAAYLMSTDGTFVPRYIKTPDLGANVTAGDQFGWHNAISGTGDIYVIAAPLEDGSGTGIDPAVNEASADSGAVYVYY
jgi:trimeric autotransporter adhesin